MQIEPSAKELVFIILNYVTCVPVILAVGAFRSVLSVLSLKSRIESCGFNLVVTICIAS
jgi:hypothetical protein